MSDKNVRDEIAELTEAVRELRDREVAAELASLRAEVEKLRAERGAHHCHGTRCCVGVHCNWGHCGCFTVHGSYYPLTGTAGYPTTWTVTSGATGVVTATNSYLTTGNTTTLTSN